VCCSTVGVGLALEQAHCNLGFAGGVVLLWLQGLGRRSFSAGADSCPCTKGNKGLDSEAGLLV
jgi:hypothetical protein